MAFATVGTSKVEYLVDGSGAGLVLVHGKGRDAISDWEALTPAFSDDWTVVRPNYSGSGNTEDKGEELTIEMLGQQVIGAAQAAGAVPFDLVGFSLGAPISAWIAANHPEMVRKLVLISGFSHGDSRSRLQFKLWSDLLYADRRLFCEMGMLTGFSPQFVASLPDDAIQAGVNGMLEGINWAGIARQVEVDIHLDIRDEIRKIVAPTLVIGCLQDQMVPINHSKELAKEITGATYREIDSGHTVLMERPEKVSKMIREFLG